MNAIKLVYIADVHEATKALRYIFTKVFADLYIVSGDFLYRPFYSYDTIYEFVSLQEDLYDLAEKRSEKIFPFDLATQIANNNEPDELKIKAGRYLTLYETAYKNMAEKYSILEGIFCRYAKSPVYIIPGNYDLDPKNTALEKRSIHQKSIEFSGYRISGFGGADVRTPGIPEKLTVKYPREVLNRLSESEPYKFFKKENPNIMVIHKPVYGYFDTLSSYGNSGSISLRNLTEEENRISLVLSGHVHDDQGIKRSNGIIFMNPGNMGRTVQPIGFSKGGFFSEISLDENPMENGFRNSIRNVKRFEIRRGHIHILEESVFDLVPKKLGKFSLFRDIKTFFLQFETSESKLKVKDLINIARKIQKRGETIAFDLLGSVSFGMSRTKSDVDMVMYHLCPEHWLCDMDVCDRSKHYKEMLLMTILHEITNSEYNFEVIDCINLRIVMEALRKNDAENDSLIRYIFYRKVSRGINKRLLKSVDGHVNNKPLVKRRVEDKLEELMLSISGSSSQKYSLAKYRDRLNEMGIRLPESIRKKILLYLGF